MADDKDISALFDEGAKQAKPADEKIKDQEMPDLAKAFDEGQAKDPVMQAASQELPDWSKLESGGQGLAEGASFGTLPAIGGAEGALMEKLGGSKKDLADLYREYRDYTQKRNETAQQANPASYIAGNIAGAATMGSLIPGGNTLRGQTLLGGLTGLGTSKADLTSGNASEYKKAALDTMLGMGLGLAGGKLGQKLAGKTSSEALEEAGSQLAAKVGAGLEPEEQAATQWIKSGDKWMKAPSGEAGTGQIAVEQGALPTFGGVSGRLKATGEAIDKNYDQLSPLLKTAQEDLDPVLDETLNNVGHVGDKLGQYYYDFQQQLGKTDQAEKMMAKLFRDNKGNIAKASSMDGNLEALNAFKRDIQDQAKRLGAYGPQQDKPAAQFLKGMAATIRQHIEDLANAANPESQVGSQVKEINNNISKLLDFQDGITESLTQQQSSKPLLDAAKSFASKGVLATAGYKMGGAPMAIALPMAASAVKSGAEAAMGGQTLGTTAKILAAKGMLKTAKVVDSPIGKLVMKPIPPAASKVISNPFSQKAMGDVSNGIAPSDKSKIASVIYNADSDSLKRITNDFKQDPSMANISNALDKYMESKDPQDLNTATFLMLQNKNAVKLLTGEE